MAKSRVIYLNPLIRFDSGRGNHKKEAFIMKKLTTLIAAAALTLGLAACTSVSPVNATANAVGSKVGEAETMTLFGALTIKPKFLYKDYSIQTAAKNGGISRISTVDVLNKNILGIVSWTTTIVTGE